MQPDEETKKKIVDELSKDLRVDAAKTEVTVESGMVTLRGTAPTLLSKSAATEVARSVQGAISVANFMTVLYPSGARIPTDEDLQKNLIAKLNSNPDINVLDLDVSVINGKIILRGTVDAYWKKPYIESLAASEPGVLDIENLVAVTPTDDLLDEAIARDIVASLEARAAVNARDVNVSVFNGRVELNGKVPDWIARESAMNAALYTNGVKQIDNNLVIAG